MDESGSYLLPGRVRTDAPCGQTPVLRVPLTRDHRSASGGITPDGALALLVREHALRGEAVVVSLKHLLRQRPGTLGVVRAGAPMQRGK